MDLNSNSSNKISIRLASKEDQNLWNDFVLNELKLIHISYAFQWSEIIEKTFKHKSFYLIAQKNSKVVGLLPLVLVKSPIFSSKLVSVPYINGCGLLLKEENEKFEVAKLLFAEALDILNSCNASFFEIRQRSALESNIFQNTNFNLNEKTHKVTYILNLEKTADEMFMSFSSKLRSQIRRPEKSGVYTKTSRENANLLDDFYSVFSENMRDLGTPTYPKSFFENTISAFGDKARIVCAYINDKPIAGGISVGIEGATEIIWASSLRKFNNLSANMLMYWQIIKLAIEDGYTIFDFGRTSKNSNTVRFKKQWNTEEYQLFWYDYFTNQKITKNILEKDNPQIQLMIKIWKNLPLPLANLLGPILTKGLP